ncbi:MAG TPA: hypothetical protein VFU05_16215 [Cyclobacteriaceae bacterium]|nr:hypothetical protein [Cyclobacteriaceae bacterium]
MDQTSTIVCDNCRIQNDSTLKFCPQCSFPMAGTVDEKRIFREHIGSQKRLLKEADKKIQQARIIILVMAGFALIQGLIQGFGETEDFQGMVVNVVLCIIYLILAAWCTQNPFGAILTALILYITVQLMNAFLDPTTMFSGIILKIIFIGGFVKGIRSAQEAKHSMAELEKLKAAPVGA